MSPDRRKQLILAALVVVLAAVLYQNWPRTAVPAAPASNQRRSGRATAGQDGPTAGGEALDVKLEALERERPMPGEMKRNLFRFKATAPPAPPPAATAPPRTPVAEGRPQPPPVPPIPLRLIGIVKDDKGAIAAFADERGVGFHGREGDTIEGRYRIVRIGEESVEMVYVDGRGRQTIPLSNR